MRAKDSKEASCPHSQARLRAVRPPPHAHETAHGAARTVRPPPVHTTRRTARDGGRRQRFRGCQLVGSICARHRCVAGAGRQRPCSRLCGCQRSRVQCLLSALICVYLPTDNYIDGAQPYSMPPAQAPPSARVAWLSPGCRQLLGSQPFSSRTHLVLRERLLATYSELGFLAR